MSVIGEFEHPEHMLPMNAAHLSLHRLLLLLAVLTLGITTHAAFAHVSNTNSSLR